MGIACSSKLKNILKRNPGFEDMKIINSVLQGEKCTGKLPLEPAALASMLFAPMTSCSVERTFSSYKNVLRDNRKSFPPENLGMYVTIYCNAKNNQQKRQENLFFVFLMDVCNS